MQHRFKKGDEVEVLKGRGQAKKGLRGKVCNILDDEVGVGVDFGKDINGHSCDDCCDETNGYYLEDNDLRKIKNRKRLKPTHIIESGENSFILVYNNKEKINRIKELVDDDNVKTNNIIIYGINTIEKVVCKVSKKKVN